MATVDYFEIPAEDVARAREFYSSLFDWKFEKSGQWDYWMFGTTGERGEPAVAGGLYKKDNPQRPILDYIGVDSIDDYLSKVEQLGGKILVPKTDTGGWGYYAICQDTENNVFGLWQAIPKTQ